MSSRGVKRGSLCRGRGMTRNRLSQQASEPVLFGLLQFPNEILAENIFFVHEGSEILNFESFDLINPDREVVCEVQWTDGTGKKSKYEGLIVQVGSKFNKLAKFFYFKDDCRWRYLVFGVKLIFCNHFHFLFLCS